MRGARLASVLHTLVAVAKREHTGTSRRDFQKLAATGVVAGLAALASLGVVSDRGRTASRHADAIVDETVETFGAPTRGLPRIPLPVLAPPTAAVSGWVIDTSGVGIADVEVTWADPNGDDPVIAYTADDGSFRLGENGARPGNLRLRGVGVFEAEVPWQGGEATARIMATRRMTVRARVTAGGVAVAGAEVVISDGSGPVAARAISDDDGTVDFDELMAGVYELWARDDMRVSGLARATRFDAGPFDDVMLELVDGATVSGRVVGDDGVALAGLVALVPIDLDHVVRHAQIDETGAFAIGALPRGRWRVEASAVGHVAGREYVVDASGDLAVIEIQLRRAGTITGHVVDDTGEPVAGAVLVLQDQSNSAVADNLPSSATTTFGGIRWIHPLAGPRRLPVFGQRFGALRPGIRAAECGRGHCGVDIGRERGSTIHAAADGTITVASRTSVGISGRFIVIEHPGGLQSLYIHLDELRSDLEVGQRVLAGEPIGTMGRTGFAIGSAHLHFAITQRHGDRRWYIDPEPMLRQAVVLPEPGSLEGHLAAAASGATPTLVATRAALAATGTASPTNVSGKDTTRVVTGDDGSFHIDGIAPSTYVVTAFHSELAPGRSKPLRVAFGAELSGVTVRLSPGVAVYGRVVGATRPIAGARVLAHEGEGESQRTVAQGVTDADGRFRLRALAGAVTIAAVAQGYGRAETAVALGPGTRGGERQVDFELTAADAELRARVVDPAGFGVAGAEVEIRGGPTARGRRSVTDADGFFSYRQLAPGRYSVEVESSDFPTTTADVTTEDIGKVVMPQGGGLAVYVRDAHSHAPLSEVRIVATGPGGAQTSVATSTAGLCELVPLAAGPWTLRADVDGYVAFSQVIEVVAGSGARVITDKPTIELARGATLGGVVYDHTGERVAGAIVRVGITSTTTDQVGAFRLRDVPTGSVSVIAEADAHSGETALDLAPGDELVTLELQLAE